MSSTAATAGTGHAPGEAPGGRGGMRLAVAITGAGGFVGQAVARRLAAGGAALRLHAGPPGAAGPADAWRFDIADATAVRAFVAGARCVVHLAGPPDIRASVRTPAECLRAHIGGAAAVLAAAAAEMACAVVHVSSTAVYGPAGRGAHGEDDAPLLGATPYAKAKIGAEAIVRAYAGQVPSVILRLANVYGPGAHPTTLIPELVARAQTGEEALARRPEARLDPVHVEDVAAAVAAAVEACGRGEPGERFPSATALDVGGGSRPTAGDVARRIAWILSSIRPRPPYPPGGPPGRIEALLGWRPAIDLDAALLALLVAQPQEPW